ncbi:Ig-like domain-containing protein [Mycolicibacterium aichiense]|uniref:Ig-like domain-containing protein n=1 Tax=Mycolicibacterium aichiense TaxID=1799 RepID=UPI003D673081
MTATPTSATAKATTITAFRMPSASASPTDVLTSLVGSIQGLFEGAALLVRRTFFNEAPTVAPVQLTGETTGPITGTIDATDPEGDHLVYKVTQQGHYGNVVVNSDGSYTYTPASDFTGVDSFVVSATDTGPHINLLNWFRTSSTYAAGSIYQEPAGTPRITYTFIYGNGSQFWSSAARAELAATAIYLSSYFEPQYDVNITYTVTGQYSLAGATLASAGSDLISDNAGFYDTVVQNKILTGVDSNGAAADGTIDWNFGYGWGYFSTVPGGSYDFQSTAMHELLHTYGFLSVVDSAASGNNAGPNWTTFDKFMVDKNGNSVFFGPDGTTFNTAYNPNLTGGVSNGMYFGGANAMAANGGNPVPLYSPNPWESGSSMSHLNDDYYTGANEKLMNASSDTGLGVRTLSPIEIGIMKDLGYTMVSASPTVAVLFIGLMLVRRRRQ